MPVFIGSVSVSVSRPSLSSKRRLGLSLFREESPSEPGNVTPYSSFEEKVQSSFLSKGVTGAGSRRGRGSHHLLDNWVGFGLPPRNSTPEINRGIMFELDYRRKYEWAHRFGI